MNEIYLNTGPRRLAVLRYGQPGGIPVLALHGWLDNAASFEPLAHALPELDWAALDLPGHGHSDHYPAGSWYHFIDYVSDVDAALDALGWPQCVLLGHSLGGAVATGFAAALPERVERLVLIEALGPLPFEPGTAVSALRKATLERRGMADKRLRIFQQLEEAIAARMQANGLSKAAAALLVQRALTAVEGGFVWRSDPRLTLTSPTRVHEQQIREWIAAITAPTLVILADPPMPYLSSELGQQRLACLQQGQAVVLPGNHHLHMEDTEKVVAAIRAFLPSAAAAA